MFSVQWNPIDPCIVICTVLLLLLLLFKINNGSFIPLQSTLVPVLFSKRTVMGCDLDDCPLRRLSVTVHTAIHTVSSVRDVRIMYVCFCLTADIPRGLSSIIYRPKILSRIPQHSCHNPESSGLNTTLQNELQNEAARCLIPHCLVDISPSSSSSSPSSSLILSSTRFNGCTSP